MSCCRFKIWSVPGDECLLFQVAVVYWGYLFVKHKRYEKFSTTIQ